MKIKKIDFRQHDKGVHYDIDTAILTTGQDARVEYIYQGDEYSDELWSWEIDTESRGGACGVAKTKELATEACQAAWEKMIMKALEEPTIRPLSWNERDTAYGVNNTGFIIEKGCEDYLVVVEPEQTIAKYHFGFKTVEEAKAWCERYNKETVEEALEWVKGDEHDTAGIE